MKKLDIRALNDRGFLYIMITDRYGSKIRFTRDSFATEEDWECLCEEIGVDPKTTKTIKVYLDNNYEIEE